MPVEAFKGKKLNQKKISLKFTFFAKFINLYFYKGGDSFGEVSFFTELPQEYTARSLNYSTVYLLDKREFLAIISESNDEEDYV